VIADERSLDGCGAPRGQIVVVAVAADVVGMSFDRDRRFVLLSALAMSFNARSDCGCSVAWLKSK
jgi:hypothetical protein